LLRRAAAPHLTRNSHEGETRVTRYDVIIIGTGAGGGTLAHRLAQTGKKILLLERGDFVPRERENWSPRAVVSEGRYDCPELWSDADGNEFRPGTHYFVGGNTKFYGAALFRMRERDFEELKHFGGISPAWPLSYADFEPYYAAAERLYNVHGNRGEDPTEPWASSAFPHAAVSHEPRIQKLHDDLARIGQRPFHVPVGVALDESNRRDSACIRCGTCDGFPCLVNAKSDADVLCVRPALARGVELHVRTRVLRLETDAAGRSVSRVIAERDGERVEYAANLVVVACGAINSAALLLRSASERHANGLGNGSGLVGRNYMCHLNTMLVALSREANPTEFHKTFALTDFYFGADDFGFPLGLIQLMGKAHAEVLKVGAPPGTPTPILRALSQRGIPFWLTSEDLPDRENRVALGANGNVRLLYTPNNLEGHERLAGKVKELLSRAGMSMKHLLPANLYVGGRIPVAGVAHQCGTTKFGRDPKTSVLDVDCKSHEIDNLYVVDGGFFPSSSAVNPALTIAANALRVGDRIAERLA
jgi:choline dehydrogenase-like flavoprotein